MRDGRRGCAVRPLSAGVADDIFYLVEGIVDKGLQGVARDAVAIEGVAGKTASSGSAPIFSPLHELEQT